MAEINLHGDAVISREWAAGKQELYISCAGMGGFDLQAYCPYAVRGDGIAGRHRPAGSAFIAPLPPGNEGPVRLAD
jgi:hypothetical protein